MAAPNSLNRIAMRHSFSFRLFLVSLGLLFVETGHADILATLERPAPNQPVSGIGTISGWVFSSVPDAQMTVRLRVDGIDAGDIPCCGDRMDVALQFPGTLQALRSGFGLLFNFNLLPEGAHTIAIEVQDSAGSPPQIQEHAITIAKPGGFEFLSDLDLSDASEEVEFGNNRQEVVIKGATAIEKDTEKAQEVNLSLAWQENLQGIGIVKSESVGEPTEGVDEDDEEDDEDDTPPPPPEIWMTLENPSAGTSTSTVSGIGVVSGWVVPSASGNTISRVRLRINGELAGDLPCCSEREDVQAAFPDYQQALRSGFGTLLNFNLFSNVADSRGDTHTLTVEVEDSVGRTQTVERNVQTVKVGGSEFLDRFDLSAATASIEEGTLLLEDVQIRDKASQQTTQVTVNYVWEQSCQCFVALPGCGDGTIESGEECDGVALDGESCTSLGFSSGLLACRPRCASDDDDCTLPCFFELKDCRGGPAVYVTNAASNTVSVINTITDEVTATVTVGKEPRGIAISPDGAVAYVTNFQGNSVSVLNTATNTVTATIAVGAGPQGVAFAPDGKRAYVVNGFDNTVSVINADTRTIETTIRVRQEPQAIALTSDGKWGYVTNFADNSVTVLNLSTNQPVNTILVGKGPNGITISPDNTKVYVVNYNGNTVSILDHETNMVTDTVQVGFSPTKVTFSADGEEAFVSNSVSKSISVIDTAEREVESTLTVATGDAVVTRPDGVVVTTGEARLYISMFGNGFGSTLSVMSTLTGDVIKIIEVGDGPFAVAVTPVTGGSP